MTTNVICPKCKRRAVVFYSPTIRCIYCGIDMIKEAEK
jgi:ribosomal protein S27E